MPDVHRFGRIEVRPAQRQLLIDAQPATLGARAFDLLLALIEHRDRLVSKNELLDLVWPGVVVEENNLQVQVSTLRKLLGPQAIATVPGRGYRFTLVADEPAPAARAPSAPPLTAPRASLPDRPALLLGRDDDLAALLAALGRHRLVTLVGPGGIGKTTLARSAAQAWAGDCAWVELASLTDGRLVAGSIAKALDLQLAGDGDALAALVSALKATQLLLVVDNAEHVIEPLAACVHALLQSAPGVQVLVTSQAPLRVHDEQVLRLEALAIPGDEGSVEAALQHGAVALFAERAHATDRRFVLTADNLPHVVDICRRLDGLPLALELAAARVPMLGVRGVAERLDDRFRLLAGGSRSAPTRQQTLQAALDWSLALLPEAERRVFRRLGVFAGGCTLALAREVLGEPGLDDWALIDAMATLADHSLLGVSPHDPPRYSFSETARAYAAEQLTRDGTDATTLRARHALAVRRFFDAAPDDWLHMTDADWLARYEPEVHNLRAALHTAHEAGDGETVVALVGAAAPLWHHLSLHDEARHWLAASEPLAAPDLPKPLLARWWRAAQWTWAESAPERSRAAAEHAHTLYRALGDAHGLYAELTGLAGTPDTPEAEALAALEEAFSVERPEWPPRERAWGQRARADVARAQGRLEESRQAREAELALRTEAGDQRGRLRALAHLADLAQALGQPEAAAERWQALVIELRGLRSPSALASALRGLARALVETNRANEARSLLDEANVLVPHAQLA
ncbi:MAG: helix-turn-helix transcriptional regulator [Rhizobacter sp.]|nr:helix-turn-helix transcriptional regulator [Rhizobacter sp.]